MGKGGCLSSTLHRLGREGCHVGKGNEKKFRAPLAPPYVWPVAIDPWQLSGPGGREGEGGEGRGVPELRRRPRRAEVVFNRRTRRNTWGEKATAETPYLLLRPASGLQINGCTVDRVRRSAWQTTAACRDVSGTGDRLPADLHKVQHQNKRNLQGTKRWLRLAGGEHALGPIRKQISICLDRWC